MATKVLILISSISNGGAERVATLWANCLADADYTVTMATLYSRDDEYQLNPKVKHIRLDQMEPVPSSSTKNTTTGSKSSFWHKLNYKLHKLWRCIFNPAQYCHSMGAGFRRILERYLTEHPQDIIIPFLTLQNVIGAALDTTNVKVVTQTIRNSPWHGSKIKQLVYRWAVRKRGSVIVQNHEQLEYFQGRRFQHVKKYVVHNPLHPAIADLQKTAYQPIRKIIAVGRLHRQKHQIMMLKAVRLLRDKYHFDCQLDIYGISIDKKDHTRQRLKQYIKRHHLRHYVNLCGRETNIFATEINYDLFLMTSKFEGTPNALLEAMGLGLPCFVTNFRTGARELVDDGVNGFILNSYSPRKLAKKIMAINNATMLRSVGEQARQDMQRYCVANCLTELTDCIQDLLSGTN